MTAKTRLLLATALCLLIFAQGCARKPPGKIVVQAPVATTSAPLLVMQERWAARGQGVKMDLIIYKTVEESTTRVIKGEADLTVLPVNVAAKLYNKGVPVRLANISAWGLLYLVTEDPDINRMADLKGREVYVGARGATPDILTAYLLHKNGIESGQVDIRYAQSPEIAQMLIAGLARTAVLPEPMVTQVVSKKPSVRVVADFSREWQAAEGGDAQLPQAGTVVREEFLKSHPGVFEDFQREYRTLLEEVSADPAGAAPLVEKSLGIPGAIFTASLERAGLRFAEAKPVQKDVISYLSRLCEYSPEMVGGKVPDDGFFVQR